MKLGQTSSLHFFGLLPILESSDFRKLEVTAEKPELKDVVVEPLHGEEGEKTFRLLRKAGNQSEILNVSEVAGVLEQLFQSGYDYSVAEQRTERTIYTRTPGGVKVKREPVVATTSGKDGFHLEVEDLVESEATRSMLVELNILNKKGEIRREQYNKLIQIKNLLSVVADMLPHLREREHLRIVDGACGKSYLSFVLYYFLTEVWRLESRFQCIDTNSRLISRCQEIQSSLGFKNMEFIVGKINEFRKTGDVDLLYSLHGCDTASDEAIATGVRLDAYGIIVIPCCHFELRSQLRRHPLKALTKYGLFEERFAALLTDSLRALAMEASSYDVTVFRFVTDDISPKNTLLRGIKRAGPKPQAQQQFDELKNMFGVSPAIERLLPMSATVR